MRLGGINVAITRKLVGAGVAEWEGQAKANAVSLRMTTMVCKSQESVCTMVTVSHARATAVGLTGANRYKVIEPNHARAHNSTPRILRRSESSRGSRMKVSTE